MQPISLVQTAGYLPGQPVPLSFYQASCETQAGFLQGGPYRHHLPRGESAADMIVHAATQLIHALSLSPATEIDIILTNVSCPDQPFNGCGVEVSHRLGTKALWVFDLHNTGCVSFLMMIALARSLMSSTPANTALICCAQTTAGRVFSDPQLQLRPESCVPGDGCGVGYLIANNDSPVVGFSHQIYSEYASDMVVTREEDKDWWEPGLSAVRPDFSEEKIPKIMLRANKIVPKIIKEACLDANLPYAALNALITNQPNRIFLRNWREALELPESAHIETFDTCGNLFGAAMPLSFSQGVAEGRIKKGDYVALGGFSHAGDFAAAAIVHWQASST